MKVRNDVSYERLRFRSRYIHVCGRIVTQTYFSSEINEAFSTSDTSSSSNIVRAFFRSIRRSANTRFRFSISVCTEDASISPILQQNSSKARCLTGLDAQFFCINFFGLLPKTELAFGYFTALEKITTHNHDVSVSIKMLANRRHEERERVVGCETYQDLWSIAE